LGCQKACVLPENPASYRVVRTKSYLFNKAAKYITSPGKHPHPRDEHLNLATTPLLRLIYFILNINELHH
ncbi:hypothetical protein, partial [Klebsiella pneumoniae]|uniref:hypothetical protein n=2 Tax=Klebsiella pneumoniae TaxID=573 RepID=UPI00312CC2C9